VERGVESEARTELAQQPVIAGCSCAEAEIFAHGDDACPETAHEELLDEALGGELRERAVERPHVDTVDACARDELGPALER
jgi:hypothetical protein